MRRRLDNLPASLTSFVGRDQAIADVVRLLRSTRLLTIIGTGGIGKTRPALEVARTTHPWFADGVCVVELAFVTQASLVG